jgi:hypothetical protein
LGDRGGVVEARPRHIDAFGATKRRQIQVWPAVCSLPELAATTAGRRIMNNVIYIVGVVVVALAVLSFFGLR